MPTLCRHKIHVKQKSFTWEKNIFVNQKLLRYNIQNSRNISSKINNRLN